MPLSDKIIMETIIPEGKTQLKVSDGGGLYLLVKGSGKYWKLAYRYEGKQKSLSLGVYPRVGLDEARVKREEAKKWLADGLDPGEMKKQRKRAPLLPLPTAEPVTTPVATLANNQPTTATQPPVTAHPMREKSEKRRLKIIQVLLDNPDYSADEQLLLQSLLNSGDSVSFDNLRTELAWMDEQQVIVLYSNIDNWNAQLTQSGYDVGLGRKWVPGIKRLT